MFNARKPINILVSKYKGKYGIEYIATFTYHVQTITGYRENELIEVCIPDAIISVIGSSKHRAIKKAVKKITELDRLYKISLIDNMEDL